MGRMDINTNETRFGVHQSGPQENPQLLVVAQALSLRNGGPRPALHCPVGLEAEREASSQENILDHFFPLVNHGEW